MCKAVEEKEVESGMLNQLMAALYIQLEILAAQSALLTMQTESMASMQESLDQRDTAAWRPDLRQA